MLKFSDFFAASPGMFLEACKKLSIQWVFSIFYMSIFLSMASNLGSFLISWKSVESSSMRNPRALEYLYAS